MTEKLIRSQIHEDNYDGIRYSIYAYNGKTKKGRIFLSSASYIIYKKKDFNWIQIVDVITEEKYRGRGYAPAILRIMLLDIQRKFPKGASIFLLVDRDNPTAIKLYMSLKFEIRFCTGRYSSAYYVMTLSTQKSIKQLKAIDLLSLYE